MYGGLIGPQFEINISTQSKPVKYDELSIHPHKLRPVFQLNPNRWNKMSDQVIVKHRSNHKQLNKSKNKYLITRSVYNQNW